MSTIYNSWAFTKDEAMKQDQNKLVYKDLVDKYKVCRYPEGTTDYDEYDIVIRRTAEYLKSSYELLKCTPDLTEDEILLICDQGNLCFGGMYYSNSKIYRVWED